MATSIDSTHHRRHRRAHLQQQKQQQQSRNSHQPLRLEIHAANANRGKLPQQQQQNHHQQQHKQQQQQQQQQSFRCVFSTTRNCNNNNNVGNGDGSIWHSSSAIGDEKEEMKKKKAVILTGSANEIAIATITPPPTTTTLPTASTSFVIPEPLTFEEFKELRRRRRSRHRHYRNGSGGDGRGWLQSTTTTTTTTMSTKSIANNTNSTSNKSKNNGSTVAADKIGNIIILPQPSSSIATTAQAAKGPPSSSQRMKASSRRRTVLPPSSLSSSVVAKDDDVDDDMDEFTSMIHSLNIDVLASTTTTTLTSSAFSTNENSKVLKANEEKKEKKKTIIKSWRRTGDMQHYPLGMDKPEVGPNDEVETRDEKDNSELGEEEEEEERDASSKTVLLLGLQDGGEVEVEVKEDPVQCAFEIFRNDVRAAKALEDVFAPDMSIIPNAHNIVVTGANVIESTTILEDGNEGDAVATKNETVPDKKEEELLGRKMELDDDNECKEEEEEEEEVVVVVEDLEKEEERNQRRLRQAEDLSGMLLVIPDNWEEQAGFVTPKSSSNDGGDGTSVVPTKKENESDERQQRLQQQHVSSTANINMTVHHNDTGTQVKKNERAIPTTGRLPPLRLSIGGGSGSIRKKISNATRKMRRSSSYSGGGSKVNEEKILDGNGKKCNARSPYSLVVTTTTMEIGGMDEDNLSIPQPQANQDLTKKNFIPFSVTKSDLIQHIHTDDVAVVRNSSNTMHIHILDVLPGQGENIVLSPMERDWNSNDRRPDIFRCGNAGEAEKSSSLSNPKATIDSSRDKERAHSSYDEVTATSKPLPVSDDKTKDTLTTSSTSHSNSEEANPSSRPTCKNTGGQCSCVDSINNGGLVKSRINQIQKQIEVQASAASLSSDSRISPLSATSIADDGRRKDNASFIRTMPIGIAKSNKREYYLTASGGCGNPGDRAGSLSYTYSC